MIKTIKYKEQEIPYSIGYYALKRYKQETKKEFKGIDLDDIEGLEILVWYSIEAGYKHNGEENPIKREDLDLILDACLMDIVASIADFFPTSPTIARKTETEKSEN